MCQLAVMSSGPLAHLRTLVYLQGKFLFFSDLLIKRTFLLFNFHKYFSDFFLFFAMCYLYLYVCRYTHTHTRTRTPCGDVKIIMSVFVYILTLFLVAPLFLVCLFCFFTRTKISKQGMVKYACHSSAEEAGGALV